MNLFFLMSAVSVDPSGVVSLPVNLDSFELDKVIGSGSKASANDWGRGDRCSTVTGGGPA